MRNSSFYNYEKDPFYYSWIFIIICLYIFFPVGIYLIYRKYTLHRRNLFTSGRGTMITSFVILFFGVLIRYYEWFFAIGDEIPDEAMKDLSVLYGNILIIAGLIILGVALLMRRRARRYQKYIHLIVNEDIDEISTIARRMNTTEDATVDDIKILISARYLQGYRLEGGRLLSPEEYTQMRDKQDLERMEETRKRLERQKYTRVVKCPNCGASNLVESKIGKCAYCNSYIE